MTSEDDGACRRTCDFCSSAVAILYCRADSAKLCLRCDHEVHSTNQLFAKHSRSLLCDACDSSPSSILRPSLSLCHNCDFQSSSHAAHERRPIEGFKGCLSVDEIAEWLGLEGVEKKESGGADVDFDGMEGYEDLLVWDTPTIVSIDDLIGSNRLERNFRAMGVPPLPKNRKAACGKYKEEIIRQLREMAKSEPISDDGHENIYSITQTQFSTLEQDLYPGNIYSDFGNSAELTRMLSFEGDSFWCTDTVDPANENLSSKLIGSSFEDSCLVPDKDSDIGGGASFVSFAHEGQPIDCVKFETPQLLPRSYPKELTSQERETAITRYKEKKRTRRFDKHVRYESRRIRAEHRTRIKGRFAKIEHQITGP